MGQIRWSLEDVRGLARRDRARALRTYSPLPCAAALLALWLRHASPIWAAAMAGMGLAWIWTVLWTMRAVGQHWRAFVRGQPDAEVVVDPNGVTWRASYGSRTLSWSGMTVEKIGGTWVCRVAGREAAYLPAASLSGEEAELFESAQNEPRETR